MLALLQRFSVDAHHAQGSHLHLIHYRPHGCEAHACAAIWEERGQVRLASPLLKRRDGVLDPQPFARQFADSLPCLDLFEEVMGWLDAACFAATRCDRVAQACREHPEWGLLCEPFDGSDAALAALRGLVRAASEHAALPPALVRECARMTVQRLLREERQLCGGQLDPIHTDDADDLGVAELPSGVRMLISLRHHVHPTHAVSLGVLAHYRMMVMAQDEPPADRCLLILPALDLRRPMTMTPRTANLHYGHRQYPLHLDRIQRSFRGAMLVVDDSDLSNSIVFACKGTALEAARAGGVRRPKGLDRAASEQLLGAFARVNRALRDRDEA